MSWPYGECGTPNAVFTSISRPVARLSSPTALPSPGERRETASDLPLETGACSTAAARSGGCTGGGCGVDRWARQSGKAPKQSGRELLHRRRKRTIRATTAGASRFLFTRASRLTRSNLRDEQATLLRTLGTAGWAGG